MSFFTLCIQNSHYFENFSSFFLYFQKIFLTLPLDFQSPSFPATARRVSDIGIPTGSPRRAERGEAMRQNRVKRVLGGNEVQDI